MTIFKYLIREVYPMVKLEETRQKSKYTPVVLEITEANECVLAASGYADWGYGWFIEEEGE